MVADALVAGAVVAGALVAVALVAGALVADALVAGAFVAGEPVAGALVAGALVAGALVTGALVPGAFVDTGVVTAGVPPTGVDPSGHVTVPSARIKVLPVGQTGTDPPPVPAPLPLPEPSAGVVAATGVVAGVPPTGVDPFGHVTVPSARIKVFPVGQTGTDPPPELPVVGPTVVTAADVAPTVVAAEVVTGVPPTGVDPSGHVTVPSAKIIVFPVGQTGDDPPVPGSTPGSPTGAGVALGMH